MLAVSSQDLAFKKLFEAGAFPASDFSHRKHLCLAYIYLVESETTRAAYVLMRGAILNLLRVNKVDADKYHDTMTHAWVLAVHHFMQKTERSESADDFIDQNPMMLDSKIMLSHYSVDLLFSEDARHQFAEPDLSEIPRYRAVDKKN